LEDPRNERKTFRNMEGLVESIKAVGVVLSVSADGYTANVSGPAGKDARQAMIAAVAQLRERLESGDFTQAG